jgi:RNA polymerase sigma factor (sigma-70 family)
VALTDGRSCPCHPDITEAIRAHRHVVDAQARALRVHPADADYDDLISDGQLALWEALATYDPGRAPLGSWLKARVRQRMIDGLRRRLGRSAGRPAISSLDEAGGADDALLGGSQTIASIDNGSHLETEQLIIESRRVDPRLPRVLRLLAAGYTRSETAQAIGVSRTSVWRLLKRLRDHT